MVLKPTIKALLNAGVLAALLPLTANAAGLGKLTVTSALGQPLRGEIELVAVTKGEAESITARIASPEAFKEARIERLKALQNVQFSVEQRTGGEPYLKVTSSQPIEEPFLDMLIELNWPSGRLLREYTILLDPPGYTQAVTVQPVDVPTAKPAAAAPQAPAAPAPEAASAIAARPVPAAQPERAAPKAGDKAEAAEKTYGPVKKGETLAAIASHVKPEGYSLEQMLVALYQSNRQAFAGSNMNRLKTGQILRVPESSEVGSIGKAEAAHEIKAHAADWNAYRQKLAAAVTESAPAREEAAKQSASGKITTAVEDKATPPKEPSRDVLKLSKGEAGGKEAQALQERIRALQEEATAREKSVKETNERIAALEKNIKDMQQLLAIKDKNLADLQKQAAATKGAPAQPEAPVARPAEPVKPAPAAEKAAPEAQPAKPEAPKAEAPKSAPKPAAKPKPVAPPPPPPEPSLVDDMLANPIYLAGGGAAALLVGLLGYMALGHRRKKNLASFEDSIMTGGDLKVNTVLGSTAGAVVDTGDTSFLTDFSQAGMGTIDTNDVDPIAEAEVYMAYGRDAQAEEILKESLTKDPNRHEIHLKLLEIYAGRKNLLAFETLASELYAATGGQGDPIWVKAAEMGRALDPNNPLYASTGTASATKLGGDTIMKGIPVATAAAVAAAGASTLAAEEFDLGLDETEPAPEDAAPDLDFNLDQEFAATMEPDAEATTVIAGESRPSPEEETALNLDFNVAETPAEEPAAEATPAVPAETETEASAENVLEFDLGSLFETPAAELTVAETTESAAPPEDTGLVLDFEAALLQPEEAPAMEAPVAAAPSGDQASTSADLAMDFAIPEPTADELQPLIESEPIVVEAAQAAPDLDFDFEIEATPAPSSAEAPQLQVPELDLGGISLDIGEAPVPAADEPLLPADADHQEAATKLDLARAYMEMGDREGAREILEEVRKEGSTQQQEEAGKLLASLD